MDIVSNCVLESTASLQTKASISSTPVHQVAMPLSEEASALRVRYEV